MKKIHLLLFLVGLLYQWGHSQVTIGQSDMPNPGDTLRVSMTNLVPAGYQKTAMDTSWNFSVLEALSQRVDTFVTVGSTPIAYQYFFVQLGGANLASPRSASSIPGLPVTQGYAFYKNSPTGFSDMGSAYTIQQIPFPAKYDNPDKLYEFPMTPGMTWSSNSAFSIAVPGLMSYTTQRQRSNIVDGWGALTTPFGTFQTLRIKSELVMHDSIYIDSINSGFPFNRNITEYKWMAAGKGIPVLQINEEGALVTASYRDIYRFEALPLTVSLGPDTAVAMGSVITIHASVNGGTPPYQVLWNTFDTGLVITVTAQELKTYSVIVMDALQTFGMAQKIVSINYPPGINDVESTCLNVYPNPSTGLVNISLPVNSRGGKAQVITPQGQVIRTFDVSFRDHSLVACLSDLKPGLYYFRLEADSAIYFSKFQITR
jgi:hypothetical protein